jgi:uncharacterized protein
LNLYLDTSDLFKLFVEEEGSQAVEERAAGAQIVAISLVGYAEFRGSLARALRADRLTRELYNDTLRVFEQSWTTYSRIPIDERLVSQSGALAERHFLRGLDSIHLASALTLKEELGEAITFSAADNRLMSAALAEGLLLPAGS